MAPWDLVDLGALVVSDLDDAQQQSLFRRVKDHPRSLVIGDVFEPGSGWRSWSSWCAGEVTWEADELAVVRAQY